MGEKLYYGGVRHMRIERQKGVMLPVSMLVRMVTDGEHHYKLNTVLMRTAYSANGVRPETTEEIVFPPDCEFRRIAFDPTTQVVTVFFWHPSFGYEDYVYGYPESFTPQYEEIPQTVSPEAEIGSAILDLFATRKSWFGGGDTANNQKDLASDE